MNKRLIETPARNPASNHFTWQLTLFFLLQSNEQRGKFNQSRAEQCCYEFRINNESMLGNLRLGKNSEAVLMATDIPLGVVLPPNSLAAALHCRVSLDEQCTSTIAFCFFLDRARAQSACVFLQWEVVTAFTSCACQWNI